MNGERAASYIFTIRLIVHSCGCVVLVVWCKFNEYTVGLRFNLHSSFSIAYYASTNCYWGVLHFTNHSTFIGTYILHRIYTLLWSKLILHQIIFLYAMCTTCCMGFEELRAHLHISMYKAEFDFFFKLRKLVMPRPKPELYVFMYV